MIVVASALRGIARCAEFTEIQANSDSTLYSKGVDNLLQIRDLACQIVENANKALAKVGKDDIKYQDVRSNYYESPKEDIAKLNASFLSELLKSFELVPKSATLESEKTSKNVEFPIENNTGSYEKADIEPIVDVTSSKCKVDKCKSAVSESLPGKSLSEDFCKKFKTVLHEVAEIDELKFSDPEMKRFAKILSSYFSIRFNAKYDPNHIHKFDRKQFRNYLASFIFAYGQSFEWDETSEFLCECEDWLNQVKAGNVKYSFPRSVGYMFFSIKNGDILSTLSEKALENSRRIYEELWLQGLDEFGYTSKTFKGREYLPTVGMNWLLKDVESLSFNHFGLKLRAAVDRIYVNSIALYHKSVESTQRILDEAYGNYQFA